MTFINTHIFFIIFILVSLFFLIFSAIYKNKYIKIICIFCFSIFFTLSVIEVFLSFYLQPTNLLPYNSKLFDTQVYNTNDLNKEHIVEVFDKTIGTMISYKNDEVKEIYDKDVIYDAEYTLYNNNIRYTQSNKNSDDMYIFMGCSFVFGEGLNDNETLPYFFSEKFNFDKKILNLGVMGKSTNTALSILRKDIIDQFQKNSKIKHVFYIIFADYFRNFRIEADNTASDNWIFKNNNWERTKQPFGFIKLIFAKSYIFMSTFQILLEQYYIPLYKKYFINSLYEIEQILKQKYNTDFTIVIYPDSLFKFNELKKTKLNKIILNKKFWYSDYMLEKGGHPNAKANKEIAEILFNYITKS